MLNKLRGFLIPLSTLADSGCLSCSLLTNSTDNSQSSIARRGQQSTSKKEKTIINDSTTAIPVQNIGNNFHCNQSIYPLNASLLNISTETLNQYYQDLVSTATSSTLDEKIENTSPKINIYYGNG